jgi:hypothetical protein
MGHYFQYHCSSDDLRSVGTLTLECASYNELAETDSEAAMLATKTPKSILSTLSHVYDAM